MLGLIENLFTQYMSSRSDRKHSEGHDTPAQRSNNRESTEYSVGDELSGDITGVAQYGLFVRLPNRESGLVFTHEVAWPGEHVSHSLGDKVTVQVIGFKAGRGLSLSIKQPRAEKTFKDFISTHRIGDTITGTIKSVVGYGVFVTLQPGVFGLLHISSMPNIKMFDKDSIGNLIKVRLANIDFDSKRITLELG